MQYLNDDVVQSIMFWLHETEITSYFFICRMFWRVIRNHYYKYDPFHKNSLGILDTGVGNAWKLGVSGGLLARTRILYDIDPLNLQLLFRGLCYGSHKHLVRLFLEHKNIYMTSIDRYHIGFINSVSIFKEFVRYICKYPQPLSKVFPVSILEVAAFRDNHKLAQYIAKTYNVSHTNWQHNPEAIIVCLYTVEDIKLYLKKGHTLDLLQIFQSYSAINNTTLAYPIIRMLRGEVLDYLYDTGFITPPVIIEFFYYNSLPNIAKWLSKHSARALI